MSTLKTNAITSRSGSDLVLTGDSSNLVDIETGFKISGTAGLPLSDIRTSSGTASASTFLRGDGTWNAPTAAAGSVYAAAYIWNGSQSFARATYAIITGWSEYTDSGSFFNATTGVFTVPTDEGGKYFFAANWGCDFNGIGSDGEKIEIRFSNNAGTPAGRGGTAFYQTTSTTNMRYGTVYTNYMASLSAGDEVALQGYWLDSDASGGNASVENCNIVGFKVAD